MESQPRTPAEAENDEDPLADLDVRYDIKEGVFKLPQGLPIGKQQILDKANKEGEIGKRTRSKLPLDNTTLDAIQSPFVAPDIPADMCESELEDEEPWLEFLDQFQKPLGGSRDSLLWVSDV